MIEALARHHLSAAELRGLTHPQTDPALLVRLRRGEVSKHKLLLELVRRRVRRERPAGAAARLEEALSSLNDVADGRVGAWCVGALAALDAGAPVNVGDLLPGRAPARVRSSADGLALEVTLDAGDPCLERLGLTAEPLDVALWQRELDAAWRLLVTRHRRMAEGIGVTVDRIVPLAARPGGATSGWAFGTVGIGLPASRAEPSRLAESLVHEHRHLVLSAIMDQVQLTRAPAARRYPSPWRREPRPIDGVLQGCFAHLAVAAFWRGGRETAAFESAYADTAAATATLAASGALTEAGQVIVEEVQRLLDGWS
ncbi:HEXXH motif-containing putative peptide modification protein [Nonomuraea sp. B19D2]